MQTGLVAFKNSVVREPDLVVLPHMLLVAQFIGPPVLCAIHAD